ncbi:hypothetical protein F0227_11185 [Vibrio sp. 99-8-1]|nr:hypothetical protein [Vibrio sp. 99-8-1]
MPDIFCDNCKKMTPHKSLMCRRQDVPSSIVQKFSQFFSHVAKGNHYYDMEPRYFCRGCNSQNIKQEAPVKPMTTSTQIGVV